MTKASQGTGKVGKKRGVSQPSYTVCAVDRARDVTNTLSVEQQVLTQQTIAIASAKNDPSDQRYGVRDFCGTRIQVQRSIAEDSPRKK
jgi:hypothetical protein